MWQASPLRFIYSRIPIRVGITLLILMLQAVQATAETAPELLERAQRLEEHGVLLEAISVYREYLRLEPEDNDARLALVRLLNELGRAIEALPLIDELGREMPNDPRVQAYVERAGRIRQQQFQDKINEYEQKVADPEVDPALVLEYARFLDENNRRTRAVEMYRLYLDKQPGDYKVRHELARRYVWRKQYERALAQLKLALQRRATYADALILYGDILYWQGDEDGALEKYRQVLKHHPRNSTAAKKIEQITSREGFREEKLLEQIEQNPTGPALLELAELYLEADRLYEARELVQRRLEAHPDDEKAHELDETIDDLLEQRRMDKISRHREQLEEEPADTTALLALA
ncbi:tetratricopeptide repeat protein, partial [bacterium]|nr:tetratricopeptide repeat protein [bacterium]